MAGAVFGDVGDTSLFFAPRIETNVSYVMRINSETRIFL